MRWKGALYRRFGSDPDAGRTVGFLRSKRSDGDAGRRQALLTFVCVSLFPLDPSSHRVLDFILSRLACALVQIPGVITKRDLKLPIFTPFHC